MIINLYKRASLPQLQMGLSLLGVLTAVWIMYIQQGWINDDSVLYFEAARLFAIGEWQSGLRLFAWPLYSLLIAGLHAITGLSLHLSAQILNALFIFISIYSLLKIMILAKADKLTLIIATLLLLSTTYIYGDVIGMLLRDQGFWAFTLLALVFFIKFYRDSQLKDALLWQVFIAIALLFRIETFTYIVLLPLILFTLPQANLSNKLRLLLKTHIINLVICALVLIAAFVYGVVQLSELGRAQEIFSAISDIEQNFSSHITKRAQIMASDVLGEPLENFAWTGLVLTLVIVVITKSVLVAGWLPPTLVAINYKTLQQNMAPDVAKILVLTGLIVLINGILIILKVNLLSSRYVILFGLIGIIFASFSTRSLIEKLQHKQLGIASKLTLGVAALFILISFIINISPKHEGYNYQKTATDYVKMHNTEHKKVFYVSPRARFYAGVPYEGRDHNYWEYTQAAILNGSIYNYDYLVINLDIDESTAAREALLKEKLSNYALIKIVYGYKQKKRMLIYEKKS